MKDANFIDGESIVRPLLVDDGQPAGHPRPVVRLGADVLEHGIPVRGIQIVIGGIERDPAVRVDLQFAVPSPRGLRRQSRDSYFGLE